MSDSKSNSDVEKNKKSSVNTKPDNTNYEWTDKKENILFECFFERLPVGIHRHLRMISVHTLYTQRVEDGKECKLSDIYKYFNGQFDTEALEKLEREKVKEAKKDLKLINFELPEILAKMAKVSKKRKASSATSVSSITSKKEQRNKRKK